VNAIERAVEAMTDAADELAAEIECRYESTKDHPAMKWRYERDMETVTKARAVAADLRRYEVVEGCHDTGIDEFRPHKPRHSYEIAALLLVRRATQHAPEESKT
jgi:di/tripeptidase